ncbi:MAG TPA: SDR family NAD(P)-dependent oxidoreductase [Pseudolabrys sp.]|jgi:short-subunit dehydrogenase|nr:SDR family NAD(P)-dependent oxidoreductase [Pseudolabrys sp.]
MPRTIFITGASSGIGRALALHYARTADVLALTGRDAARLQAVADECRDSGATIRSGLIDVRHREEMAEWIADLDRASPIDLVIANAGSMAGTTPTGDLEPAEAGYEAVETNALGVLNTVQPLLQAMTARGRGQIAIVSSIAAFVPLPDSPSYCASKSAVLAYGLSLRAALAPRGIRVSVICPGYVRTPMMLREQGSKPFAILPERAAALIATGLERNRPVIAFPRVFALATRIHGLLPDRVRRLLLQRSRFTVAGRSSDQCRS